MTAKEIATEIALREGLKHQITMGDAREVVRIISELIAEDVTVLETLLKLSKTRKKKK